MTGLGRLERIFMSLSPLVGLEGEILRYLLGQGGGDKPVSCVVVRVDGAVVVVTVVDGPVVWLDVGRLWQWWDSLLFVSGLPAVDCEYASRIARRHVVDKRVGGCCGG